MLRITPSNPELEEKGVWTKYRDVGLLIARSNNVKYRAKFRKVIEPYQDVEGNINCSEEKSAELLAIALADTVLLDWDKDSFPGKVEFTEENAEDLLTHDEDCRNFVIDFSGKIDNYIQKSEDQIVGE